MQNFVVSARKYRPASFNLVVGQSHITTTLKNAIQTSHLAQAFLFCGPRGVGKTTCARILAKTINCENLLPDTEACGECSSCSSYQNNNSFNIHELDAASNNSVDDIRNLNDQVRIPPQYGKFKIYIIDEVHMLSTQAFNAFLKTLEEPPKYAIFILATTEKHKILPTILSRCQIFDFNRIKISDISTQLGQIAKSEGIPFEEEGLRVIAQKADGGMRDALSMFDMISTFSGERGVTYQEVISNLHILDSDYYFKITSHLLEGSTNRLLLLYNEILQKGFDGHHFILGLADHFRNILVASDPSTLILLEFGEEKQPLFIEQASKANPGVFLNLLSIAASVDIQYKNSKNQRLLVELALLKMANVKFALSELEAEKKKYKPEQSERISFKTIEPTISVKDGPKLERNSFKNTINISGQGSVNKPIKSQEQIIKREEVENNDDPIRQLYNFEELGFLKSKEIYLEWDRKNSANSISAWSLALEEFLEEETIFLTFPNDFLLEDFQKEKIKITHFFKDRFDKSLNFSPSISLKPSSEIKPYTNSEKFNYLARKYSILADLKIKLGLEVN